MSFPPSVLDKITRIRAAFPTSSAPIDVSEKVPPFSTFKQHSDEEETPTSDFESFGCVTPDDPLTPTIPATPFQSKYKVRVTDPEKNGETVTFTLCTSTANNTSECVVKREFEDFEWFHHCLFTNLTTAGIVVPPLPSKPLTSPSQTYSKSKETLGSSAKTVIADQYQLECRGLERYLRLVTSHQTLGNYNALETFLLSEEPPYRSNIRKGILGKLSSAVDSARKSNHKDIDDYFQNQKEFANKYATDINELNQNFHKVLASGKKVANAYSHLSTVLNMGGNHQVKGCAENQKSNQLLVKFSDVIEDAQHCSTVDYTNDENTLGFHLDYSSKFTEALKEMFYRRTCLLVAYEVCNKTLAKAKPNKQELAEAAKIKAEKALEECTEIARKEIVSFHHQRVLSFQEALVLYTEAKIKTARDTYTLLMKSLVQFKQIKV